MHNIKSGWNNRGIPGAILGAGKSLTHKTASTTGKAAGIIGELKSSGPKNFIKHKAQTKVSSIKKGFKRKVKNTVTPIKTTFTEAKKRKTGGFYEVKNKNKDK
jgi:hypothetical protein